MKVEGREETAFVEIDGKKLSIRKTRRAALA